MKRILLLSALLLSPALADHHGDAKKTQKKAAVDAPETTPAKEEWIQLFNGKDLTGWTPKFSGYKLGENHNKTFGVKDGYLTVDYSNYEKWDGAFGHLFYKAPYSHYRLRATYRFAGDQVTDGPEWAQKNNGLMVHCQDPKTMKIDQNFPKCIEVQLLGSLKEGDNRGTLNIVTPGTHVVWKGELKKQHVLDIKGPAIADDRWVTVEVEMQGDKAKHLHDGKVVAEYSDIQLDDGTPLTSGYISIQGETAPIQFKSIEILPLEENEAP